MPTFEPAATLQEHATKADATRQQMDTEIARIEANPELSPQGKQTKVAEIENRYRGISDKLTADADAVLADQVRILSSRLKDEQIKQAEEKRRVLGPEIYADILRRKVEAMTPAEMMAAVEDEGDEFTRMVLREFALLNLPPGSPEYSALSREARGVVGEVADRLTMARQARQSVPERVTVFRKEALAQRFGVLR